MYYKTQYRYISRFLENHDIYELFVEEYTKSNWNRIPVKQFLSWEHLDILFSLAFNWQYTKNGWEFWNKINDIWEAEIPGILEKVSNHYRNKR